MCDICLQYECPPQCPNYQETRIGHCCECNENIFKEDYYFVDEDGNKFCSEKCSMDWHGIRRIHN